MNSYSLTHLSDAVLLRDLRALLARDRELTATLLAHIAEVDERRLYAPAGYSSMFTYCVDELSLSEDAAGRRITAARAARRFPVLFSAVATGGLHLTAVCLIAPHLSEENAEELVLAAMHRGKSEIQKWLASRFTQALVAPPIASIRPVAQSGSNNADGARGQFTLDQHALAHVKSATPVMDRERDDLPAPERFVVQVTIEKSTHDKLCHAHALLSHVVSSRDVAEVLDRALDALIEKLEKRRLGSVLRCGSPDNRQAKHSVGKVAVKSRYIAAHVRRAVWERDRGRCTFMSMSGHRCGERHLLQFDHVEPFARGGTPSVEGLRLRCRAHNQLEAERAFGREFMNRKRKGTGREIARTAARATRTRATQAPAAKARTRPVPHGSATDELTQDVLAGLRGLGCRSEEARRAALLSASLESGTLEERMRAALGFIARRSVRLGSPRSG